MPAIPALEEQKQASLSCLSSEPAGTRDPILENICAITPSHGSYQMRNARSLVNLGCWVEKFNFYQQRVWVSPGSMYWRAALEIRAFHIAGWEVDYDFSISETRPLLAKGWQYAGLPYIPTSQGQCALQIRSLPGHPCVSYVGPTWLSPEAG